MLHTEQMLLLKKGSKEGKMIALLQPEAVEEFFTLAHLIPAIVVPVCVTTMVGLLLM